MTTTILQRVFALAEVSNNEFALYGPLASVCRKLDSNHDVADKAHTISGILKKLEPAEQERVVAAAEALRAKA